MAELNTDRPLKEPSSDKLGRAGFAESLAKTIIEWNIEDGFVIGLYGEWGAGKTSTINFLLKYIDILEKEDSKKPIIVKFNPWWFSDNDQLLLQFFSSIKHAIGQVDQSARLGKLGDALDTFGLVLSTLSLIPEPVISVTLKGAAGVLKNAGSAVKKAAGLAQTDIHWVRYQIDEGIRKLERKILIVIDDIERLPGDEIRQILRLVNAVADFPNTIYLLSFDRKRVEEVLGPENSDYGKNFIDKIIQLPIELPMPSQVSLNKMLSECVTAVIKDVPDEI